MAFHSKWQCGQPLIPTPSPAAKRALQPGALPIYSRLKPYSEWVWIAALAALYAVHAVHLRADFPNYSPWMDYAKYTDEGWYGNAAIEAFLRGSWYVPGDFNTAAALPVWPFLEWLLFHFTGVSLAAARALSVAVFGASLLLVYALVRTPSAETAAPGQHRQPRWVALLAVTLVASSSFLYCFSRLAILEPLVVLLLLLSWLIALRLPAAQAPRTAALAAIGLLLCLMVLTKTTAIVLLPSVFCLLWERRSLRRSLRSALTVAVGAVVPWLAYFLLFVRPHYLADYKYLFSANIYEQPATVGGWIMAFWYAVHGGLWIDGTLFMVGALVVLLSTAWLRSLWSNRLYVAALVALAVHLLFIGYHNNMQPRYYTIAAFPLATVVALALPQLLAQQRALGRIVLAMLAATTLYNAWQTVDYALHPEYTFVNAATGLTRYIDQHPNGNRLLLSISGNEIGLIAGLPAICDDFGTLELPARIHQYQPGWYAAWNEVDPGTLEDIQTQFRLEEVAKYPAFDDPDRNVLILYKMHPLPRSRQRLDSGGDGLDDDKAPDDNTGHADDAIKSATDKGPPPASSTGRL